MAKKFAGFTAQQTELLARKIGFNGPMDQFQNFLKSDSGLQNKFKTYEDKAKQLVEGQAVRPGFASGGLVEKSTSPKTASSAYGMPAGSGGSSSSLPAGVAAGILNRTTGSSNSTPTPSTPAVNPDPNSQSMGAATTTTLPITTTDEKGKSTTIQVSAVTPNANSAGAQMTNDMVTNPGDYVTAPNTSEISVGADQTLDPNAYQVSGSGDAAAQQGSTATAANPDPMQAHTVDAATVSDQVQNVTDGMQAAQGTVNQNSLVEAQTADPSIKATVQGQLNELMAQFEDGNVPAWAAGALRNANAIMAKRGLGASSMAASASTQAAMESALEIAIRDAATYSTFEQQNLNNRQQAALQNAQAFLQMDLANLDNEQQTMLAKSQMMVQSLFNDQAAVNAAAQFNATSQNQTDQFFASLKSQTDQFNAAQSNAMEQFNVNESNAMEQFNKQMNEQREQFNASNRLIVDQSNAEWRRQVTTINNAEANENARLTAQMMTNMTTAAYNNLMQRERDEYSFLYQASENTLQRAADMVMAKYTAGQASKAAKGQALGSLAGSIINGLFS